MKTWSYNEITEQVEKSIISLMDEARQNMDDFEKAHQLVDWAFGSYLLWDDLIPACPEKEHDKKRLFALTQDETLDSLY